MNWWRPRSAVLRASPVRTAPVPREMPPRAAGIYRDNVAPEPRGFAARRGRRAGPESGRATCHDHPGRNAAAVCRAEIQSRTTAASPANSASSAPCYRPMSPPRRRLQANERSSWQLPQPAVNRRLAARRHATMGELARRPREHSYASAASRIVTNAVRRQDVPD
jgi:hypothetical protein